MLLSARREWSEAGLSALYGFGKPYDFHKILPFVAGLFLLLIILAAAGGNRRLSQPLGLFFTRPRRLQCLKD
jgi:predicted ferric reductase